MRLFLDANILFSAAPSPDGRSSAIVFLATRGSCQLCSSPHAVEEARRNLELKKPASVPRLAEILEVVRVLGDAPPEIIAWARAQGLPEKDVPILAASRAARADFLVTSDRKHFGHLFREVAGGVEVILPARALGPGPGRDLRPVGAEPHSS